MKSIRALERGLEVLRLLNQYEGRSLQALHEASGLPKATLLRILHTLEQSGLAWRAIYDGEWRCSVSLAAAERMSERAPRLAEAAAPHLAALQRKGKRVTVVSTMATPTPMISDELRRQADAFVDVADLIKSVGREPAERIAREAVDRMVRHTEDPVK